MMWVWHRAATLIMFSFLIHFGGLGCQGRYLPIHIETENKVRLDGPLEGQFTASLASTQSSASLQEQRIESPGWQNGSAAAAETKIGVVDVDGLLLNTNLVGLYSSGENPVALFREKLDHFERDPSVGAVVVRLNSPGGSVAATELMAHDLEQFRERSNKPVIVSIQDIGCGGGYFLAAHADYILAQPGSLIGGVGVILNLYNLQDMMAQFNILTQPIKAGALIDMGTASHALTPEARELLQAMADRYHLRFKQHVIMRRRLTTQAEAWLDGRVVDADQAQRTGWIDQIGFMEDALLKARELAKAPEAAAVMLRRPGDAARTPHAVTPNAPIALMPLNLPGMDRSKLPTFMYAWAPDPSLDRVQGK